MRINVQILQNFLKDFQIADKLKLPPQRVERAFIENIQDELSIGHSIQDVTDNTLLLLFGMAEAEHIPTRTHFKNITDLHDELDIAIRKAIINNEKPTAYLNNAEPIIAFIKEYKLPERLKLQHEVIQDILLKYIFYDVALGRSYRDAAAAALLELDGKAIDTHITSGEEDFDLAYTLEKELIKAIEEACK